KIVSFSRQLAGEIRARGEAEAAQYIKELQQNPELAISLKTMDFMQRGINTNRATLVLTPATPGFGFLRMDALSGLELGQIPDSGLTRALAPYLDQVKEGAPAVTETAGEEDPADDDDQAAERMSRSGS